MSFSVAYLFGFENKPSEFIGNMGKSLLFGLVGRGVFPVVSSKLTEALYTMTFRLIKCHNRKTH